MPCAMHRHGSTGGATGSLMVPGWQPSQEGRRQAAAQAFGFAITPTADAQQMTVRVRAMKVMKGKRPTK